MRAPSYAFLCRRAGLPEPTGLANIGSTTRRQPKRLARIKSRKLRVWLDQMVAVGSLMRTADGRYIMP